MNTYRRSRIVFGLSVAIAVAACGGGTPATNGPGGPAATTAATSLPVSQGPIGGPAIDACSFLTADDIKAVTGNAVDTATGGPQGGVFTAGCEWVLVDADAIVPPSIVLGIMTSGGRKYFDAYFAPFNEGAGYKPIAGLGDEAWDAGFGTVQVVSGDAFFNLQYLGDGDHEVELARWVVINLGG